MVGRVGDEQAADDPGQRFAVGQRPDGTRVYFVAADDVTGTMADKALASARRSIVLPDDAISRRSPPR